MDAAGATAGASTAPWTAAQALPPGSAWRPWHPAAHGRPADASPPAAAMRSRWDRPGWGGTDRRPWLARPALATADRRATPMSAQGHRRCRHRRGAGSIAGSGKRRRPQREASCVAAATTSPCGSGVGILDSGDPDPCPRRLRRPGACTGGRPSGAYRAGGQELAVNPVLRRPGSGDQAQVTQPRRPG